MCMLYYSTKERRSLPCATSSNTHIHTQLVRFVDTRPVSWIGNPVHGHLTRYVKLQVAHAHAGNVFHKGKPLVSDPGMHHGTHVPWCMSGSLTRGGGENVPSRRLMVRKPVHGQTCVIHMSRTTCPRVRRRMQRTGDCFNIKMLSYPCRDSHDKNKTTVLIFSWESYAWKECLYTETGSRIGDECV